VIVQDDHFDTDSVTLCPFTTDPADAPLFRLLIEPDPGNSMDMPTCTGRDPCADPITG
jgi:mRNA interferase MazF